MTRLVDWLCLLGVFLLAGHAFYAGGYFSGILLVVATVWFLRLRHRWRKRGDTNAKRLASYLSYEDRA